MHQNSILIRVELRLEINNLEDKQEIALLVSCEKLYEVLTNLLPSKLDPMKENSLV